MSINQQFNRHFAWQQSPLLVMPQNLENILEKAPNLELRTAEKHQPDQEEMVLLHNLYNYIPTVYICVDINGNILSVNKFGAQSLGYSPEELIQQNITSLFTPLDQQKLSDDLSNLLKEGSVDKIINWELCLCCPKSDIIWVKVVARILPRENGNLATEDRLQEQAIAKTPVILMVCEDITKYKSSDNTWRERELATSQEIAQKQLEEGEIINHLKDGFLNMVSHELRTPLTNMKMAIQMLNIALNQQPSSTLAVVASESELSQANRYLQILNNECDREINLINNFLDLQRLDTNTKPLVMETLEINSWLTKVVHMFQARHYRCDHDLSLNIFPNLPTLICDPFSLERILIELLNNACKFSPPGSQIRITARKSLNCIQLQVENFGVEIPAAELPKIFDKFYRIPSNDPGKQGGTGLGLALVKKLIIHLGGNIFVESHFNSTCFTVQFPIVQGEN